VVLPLLKPKAVVIGLSSRALNDRGTFQQEVYERYMESRGRADFLGTTTIAQQIELTAERVSAFYRFRSKLQSPYRFFRDLRLGGFRHPWLTEFGYNTSLAQIQYRVSDEFSDRAVTSEFNDYSIGGTELTALDQLIRAAATQGAKVYLINMPVIEADYVPLHPRGAQDYEKYRNTFLDFAANDRVWAGSALLAQDRELFADPEHVNANGAAQLTRWVADLVRAP
jgi:hypothetical protein